MEVEDKLMKLRFNPLKCMFGTKDSFCRAWLAHLIFDCLVPVTASLISPLKLGIPETFYHLRETYLSKHRSLDSLLGDADQVIILLFGWLRSLKRMQM